MGSSSRPILACFLALLLSACASAPSTQQAAAPGPPPPPAVQTAEVETVWLYLEYNDRMFADPDSIREMLDFLAESLERQLERYDIRGMRIESLSDYDPESHDYLLRIRIDDYHGGPQKTVFLHYALSGRGLKSVLAGDIRLSTIKGSGKLMRVIAARLAATVDSRVQAE